MIFEETEIPGAWIIRMEPHRDDRGSFARSFCVREFAERGLDTRVAQCNVSFNRRRGTLRGLHRQESPHGEAKLVRCTRGALYDVILDLRTDSLAHGKHLGVELREGDDRLLFVPAGVFHGFLTLADETEVFYQMSEFYEPSSAVGVRFDDPAFSIPWPEAVRQISPRDAAYPDWTS